MLTDTKTIVPEVKDTEFAIRLSVTQPIEDFQERVPDMAYKVCVNSQLTNLFFFPKLSWHYLT